MALGHVSIMAMSLHRSDTNCYNLSLDSPCFFYYSVSHGPTFHHRSFALCDAVRCRGESGHKNCIIIMTTETAQQAPQVVVIDFSHIDFSQMPEVAGLALAVLTAGIAIGLAIGHVRKILHTV